MKGELLSVRKKCWVLGGSAAGLFFFTGMVFFTLRPDPVRPTTQSPAPIQVEALRVFSHDPAAFTQGLVFGSGYFYEGTGRKGQSVLRKIDPETGAVVLQTAIPDTYFGEGITILKDRVYQLTWKAGIGFIYDKYNLARVGTFRYSGNGWGLTTDGRSFILSDGSDVLRFLKPEGFTELRRLRVRDGSATIDQINELEYAKGFIYANIWRSNEIIKISPKTGIVMARYDLSSLLTEGRPPDSEGVLNGIAYDATGDRFFVTGKLWPKLFEVRFPED